MDLTLPSPLLYYGPLTCCTSGDVLSCAVEVDASGAVAAVLFARNGEWPEDPGGCAAFGAGAVAMPEGDKLGVVPALSVSSSVSLLLNFGETPFKVHKDRCSCCLRKDPCSCC